MFNKLILTLGFTVSLLVSLPSQALMLSPGDEYTNEIFFPAYNNPDAADLSVITGATVSELLYKDNAGGVEEGLLQYIEAYDTIYDDVADASAARISYVAGAVMDADWLVVKDGSQAPSWYLFDVSAWNGTDTIMLDGFWLAQGAISHVSFFGGSTAVSEPATLLLFSMGLLGLAFARRRV